MIKRTLINISIIYTILTVSSSILNLAIGVSTDTHFHLLARFALTVVGVSSLLIFKWLENLPVYLAHAIHYLATMLLVFFIVWSSQLIEPLAEHAYRDVFFNFTGIYVVFSILYLIIGKFRSSKNIDRDTHNY